MKYYRLSFLFHYVSTRTCDLDHNLTICAEFFNIYTSHGYQMALSVAYENPMNRLDVFLVSTAHLNLRRQFLPVIGGGGERGVGVSFKISWLRNMPCVAER